MTDYRFVAAMRIAVQLDRNTLRRAWGMVAATSRHLDHKAVGVNSSHQPGPDRKMLRNDCRKKRYCLFHNRFRFLLPPPIFAISRR
ncbi:MAG: hypothetical protein BGO16_16295 [Nitrobacter sp. 62-23]|nr:MAG: hypothetical protein BGO16_16295 [Nitrobacter sp. 62-23]